jgi:hypothetical protein
MVLRTAAKDVYDSTRGIIFFGTPHNARSIGGWRSILTRIHSVAREYNDRVGAMKISATDVEALLNDFSSFESMIDRPKILLYSFYEKFESFHNGVPLLVSIIFCMLLRLGSLIRRLIRRHHARSQLYIMPCSIRRNAFLRLMDITSRCADFRALILLVVGWSAEPYRRC